MQRVNEAGMPVSNGSVVVAEERGWCGGRVAGVGRWRAARQIGQARWGSSLSAQRVHHLPFWNWVVVGSGPASVVRQWSNVARPFWTSIVCAGGGGGAPGMCS